MSNRKCSTAWWVGKTLANSNNAPYSLKIIFAVFDSLLLQIVFNLDDLFVVILCEFLNKFILDLHKNKTKHLTIEIKHEMWDWSR